MFVALLSSSPSADLLDALALEAEGVDKITDDLESAGDWSIIVIDLTSDPLRTLRTGRRLSEDGAIPVLALIDSSQTGLLENERWLADFLRTPIDAVELQLRLRRLIVVPEETTIITYKSLELNLHTYQATVDGRPIDLTYMEYELLRFFVENRSRAWSREQLLQEVWGYDYYGGARTVDVHVRRLRSKLGDKRANWITTVRSVGYRFG